MTTVTDANGETKKWCAKKSLYPCPNCGEYKLVYPDVKGEYGWKDTSKYICTSCGKESPAPMVRGGKKV